MGRPSPENAVKVWRALQRFGAPLAKLTSADFARPGIFYVIGVAPNRIDVITSIEPLSFDDEPDDRKLWRPRRSCRSPISSGARRPRSPQDRVDVEQLEYGSRKAKRKKRRG